MRTIVIFSFILLSISALYAQPANDECAGAEFLSLGTPGGCPGSVPAVDVFAGTNLDATATTPYPTFSGCAGGSNAAPAAEVWYTFTATGEITTIEVTSGFVSPSLILYIGDDCENLLPVECASGVALAANTSIGSTYFLAVSGDNIGDQNNFDLSITSQEQCDVCLSGSGLSLTAFPSPDNGTYSPGQTVQFCLTITEYAHLGANWIHAVTVDLGSGWDQTSVAVSSVPAGTAAGEWGWFDSWTGCLTGESYGPGFGFDSTQQGSCDGNTIDGNPGNNWGDPTIPSTANPFVFCWQVTVDENAGAGADLSMDIEVWADNVTGSWSGGTICESDDDPPLSFLGSVNDCGSTEIGIVESNVSCPGGSDGSFLVTTSGLFNYTIYDIDGNEVDFCNSCASYTQTGLEAGIFSIVAEDVVSGCFQSVFANINEDEQPVASGVQLNNPCPGTFAQLSGDVEGGNGSTTVFYQWTGPDGTVYNGQTVSVPDPGNYELIVTMGGCESEPVDVEAVFVDFVSDIIYDELEVCINEDLTFSASNGVTWFWQDLNTGNVIGTAETLTYTFTESTTIRLTSRDANGCQYEDEVDITVHQLPFIQIDVTGNGCTNSETVLTAQGAGPGGTYVWQNDPSAPNSWSIQGWDPGFYDITVVGTDANGCSSSAEVSIEITPIPVATIDVVEETVCTGQDITVMVNGDDIIGVFWYDNLGPANQNPITVNLDQSVIVTADVTNTFGCVETFFTEIEAEMPPEPTTIQCGFITSNSIEFVWLDIVGADHYEVTIGANDPEIVLGSVYEVNNLLPETDVTITVLPVGENICPMESTTFTCTTLPCPPITLDIDPVAGICLDGNVTVFDLTYNTSVPNPMVSWQGNGITNTANGTFDPTNAGAGNHEVILNLVDGDCTYADTIDINVFALPSSDFSISTAPVCANENVTITYDGSASAGATYAWDFGGGMVNQGSGMGPYMVSWPNGGTQTVTLTVTEGGCVSTETTHMVDIASAIDAPVIICETLTVSSVTFSWMAVAEATGYTVNVVTGQTGTEMGTSITFDDLAPNETVTIEVTANTDNPCGSSMAEQTCTSLNCPAYTVDITSIPDICLNGNNGTITLTAAITGGNGGTTTWSGPGVTGDQFNPAAADAGAGQHTITATYTEGDCTGTGTIMVDVYDTPTADFTIAESEVCINDLATIAYNGTAGAMATYTWNFNGGTATPGTGVGPHTVSWPTGGDKTVSLTVTENGCVSTSAMQMISVLNPITAPVINCTPSTSDIIFSWDAVPGASSYMVSILNAPAGATSVYDDVALTFTVSGLNAGESVEIEVIAVDDGPCPNNSATQTCVAEDCPMVVIDIDAVTPICLDANATTVDLNAMFTGGAGGGVEFWTGTGITDTLGVFDPNVSQAGTWPLSVTYTEGNCQYNASTEIIVNAQPTADFTVDTNICQTGTATAIYTGSASAAATYDWDFGTATAIPGTGAGPHTLSWPAGGMQPISLTVTENDCASEPFNETVQVDEPLAAPQIMCAATTSTITFSWDAVPNATGYMLSVISIPGTATGVYDDVTLTYSVTDLIAGESVEIEVVAEGDGACGNSSQNLSCLAQNCPMVTIDIDPVAPVCLDANAGVINLNATITGGMGNGSEVWSGTGITDAMGVFDPNVSGPGDWTITVTYTEDICPYTETIDITVNPQPTADFTIDNNDVCVEQPITVTYTGMVGANGIYDWDFDGGTATPGTGAGPHTVSWANGGTPVISLTVTENDCASTLFSEMVAVSDSLIAPIVGCDSDNTSVTFSWDPVIGATGYTIDVLTEPAGAAGVFDDVALTYSYMNLVPGDEVTILVTVQTDSPCGEVSTEMTCSAISCADLTFEEITFGPYCTDEGLQNLVTTIGDNSGTFTWSGAGVDDVAATFDPATSGTGMIPVSVQYELNSCFYDTTYQIVVNTVPTASFTIDSPICVENTATLTFDGSASAAAVYSWDLDSGAIESGVDPGPYEVAWSTGGDYMITLDVTDNGCASGSFSLPITVDAVIEPVEIICQTTTSTEVTFAWDDVVGADNYDVTVIDGPMGTQNGNTYTMTGLSPDQVVSIEVTASGSSLCGSSTAIGTCTAQACQPLTLNIDGSSTLCAGDNGIINFDFTTSQAGPFEVTYTVNGTEEQMIFDGDGVLTLDNLTASTTVEVVSIVDVNVMECAYPGGQMWAIEVDQMVEAGQITDNIDLCEGEIQIIDLNALLAGADGNGVWTETSGTTSTGGAFNATAGSFNTAGQAAQDYSFVYTVAGGACPDDTAEASVVVNAAPQADAGQNLMISCEMGTATLGGNTTTPGQTYLWTSTNPSAIIADPNDQFTEISSPGDYTLEVTNAAGCSSTDEVSVSASFDVPVADVSLSDISCFEASDGAIIINNVEGGVAPYTYSLNGGAMTTNTFFGNLDPGEYSLVVQGGNDCFTELFINIEQPEQVVVELVANISNEDNIINLGETVVLTALYSPSINIDTIIWKPDSLNTEALNNINVTPQQTSTYTVSIINANGCADSDDMTIIVQKDRGVFVPSAFSPNGDGNNDILFIGASPEVKEIKSFLIFNRWGESVFENFDFSPNDPAQGWDGMQNGTEANSAVFVYMVEVEFIDGEVRIFSGDVMLMK